jgi:hypothetical protein
MSGERPFRQRLLRKRVSASGVWGALTRSGVSDVRVGRRIVRPSRFEELVLVLWSLCCLVCRCVLQLVLLRRRSEEFKEWAGQGSNLRPWD